MTFSAYSEYEIERYLKSLNLPKKYEYGILTIMLMVEPLLHYLPRGIPQYTDHGVLHSKNLLRLLCNFIDNWAGKTFTNEEKYLLSIAVWLHDIGCLLGREKHNEKSVELLKHPRFSFIENLLDGDLLSCLRYIIISHSSNYNLKKIPRDPIHPDVKLELVCATFRLIDGCDITEARTKPILYDILKDHSLLEEKNRKIWECHSSTIGAVFNGNNIIITYRKSRKKEAELLIRHLREDLKRLNKIFKKYGSTFKIVLRSSEY